MLPPAPPSIPSEPLPPAPPAPRKRGDGFVIVALLFSGLAIIAGALSFLRSSQTLAALEKMQQEQAVQANIAGAAGKNGAALEVTRPRFVDLAIDDNDAFAGNADAKVTVVEFSDFQCPFCEQYSKTTKQVREAYSPDQVRFVYKHFPLSSIHTNAEPAAIASQCVADLAGSEAFFEYHDQLFARQADLGDALYKELATDIDGLDQAKFLDCYTNKSSLKEVQDDYDQGTAAQVSGTPSTFINNERVEGGALTFAALKTLIDAALAK